MTRDEMIRKLHSLRVGTKIRYKGKVYTVMGISGSSGKLHRRDLGLLEEGKPETYEIEGKYLAAGKMLPCSNIEHYTWYARPMNMHFEIIE